MCFACVCLISPTIKSADAWFAFYLYLQIKQYSPKHKSQNASCWWNYYREPHERNFNIKRCSNFILYTYITIWWYNHMFSTCINEWQPFYRWKEHSIWWILQINFILCHFLKLDGSHMCITYFGVFHIATYYSWFTVGLLHNERQDIYIPVAFKNPSALGHLMCLHAVCKCPFHIAKPHQNMRGTKCTQLCVEISVSFVFLLPAMLGCKN